MFPAVPFFNLPKLRKLIESDLPPAPHGLRATWKELLEIHRRQRMNPDYAFIPKLPQSTGTRTEDIILEHEASLANEREWASREERITDGSESSCSPKLGELRLCSLVVEKSSHE